MSEEHRCTLFSGGTEASSVRSLAYPDPLLHQVCYAAIMIACVVLVQEDYRAPQLSPATIQQAKDLNLYGTIIFVAGFVIWNIGKMKRFRLPKSELTHMASFQTISTAMA